VGTGSRRVAFVEDEVYDGERRRQTSCERPAGNLERDARLGKSSLRPDDSLGDGRLRDEERTRDLPGRQTSDQAERESNTRLSGEDWMTGDEHEAKQVVTNVIVDGGVEIRHSHRLGL